jgi:polyphosphate kinase 2 (PPK2 family)
MKFYATSCPGCQLIHGARLQERLCTYDRWALLAALQGMDAAGKDGAIEHVVSGINPQGCEVYPFRPRTAEELDHHFLWRTAVRLPERGHIGIFNCSHYEEVLVVRVHPYTLARRKPPDKLAAKNIRNERFKDIRAFERHRTTRSLRLTSSGRAAHHRHSNRAILRFRRDLEATHRNRRSPPGHL